ncbi:hypothetical protein Bpfe_011889 [Biomphalaria pfeifferi]|uniref:Uncharacterized protein n=1 Tax=Biomphalaria pfeifferi TaxID=112525 RepID=A0AAD8BRQ6_BIOPF|nr:hypothetical protein Bpfe_011889 [Biomphalaria pfeifferi]
MSSVTSWLDSNAFKSVYLGQVFGSLNYAVPMIYSSSRRNTFHMQTASSPSLTSCFSQAFPKQQSELSSLDSVDDERWKTEQTT